MIYQILFRLTVILLSISFLFYHDSILVHAEQSKFEPIQQINLSRRKWESKGICNYSYQIQINCFCPFNGIPIDIEVHNNSVVSIKKASKVNFDVDKYFKPYSNIQRVFDSIENEIKNNNQLGFKKIIVESKFDDIYGFPKHFKMRYDVPGSDSDIEFIIRKFRILQ